jgi:ABC-2 type transport system ATP-binding protein
MERATMLDVKEISKWYGGKCAVDGMTFSLKKGEVLAFIGPNGAGKSTTMRMITGYIPASSGTVSIGGADIEQDPIRAKAMLGYLPENAPLYENMTVSGFLAFAAEIRGFRGAERRKRVERAVEICFLQPVRHQSIATLSKGYKHRTCFAQAILHDPDLLILDEPTDGLDPNQKREVRNLIKSMGESKAIIISTHILEEVEAVASRVILIDRGRNVFDGTPESFRCQSGKPERLDDVFARLTRPEQEEK